MKEAVRKGGFFWKCMTEAKAQNNEAERIADEVEPNLRREARSKAQLRRGRGDGNG
jgi:hypothetical protein